MRFFSRAMMGLFLLAVTVGLAGHGGHDRPRRGRGQPCRRGGGPPARERVFAAEVVTVTPRHCAPC